MKKYALWIYIAIFFLLVGIAPTLPQQAVNTYMSLAILGGGLLAIIFQKVFERGRFVDMGFRINRNAFIGMGIGLLFTGIVLLFNFGLPIIMGWAEISLNEQSPVAQGQIPAVVLLPFTIIFGGAVMFIACLFGEELSFRGYILPNLEERYGYLRSIILCAIIFALWHLPAYFSIYRGGAGEKGWGGISLMLLAHGISVVPICILYLTTRELYGISLYHALVDIFQYSVVGNPEFGDAARLAIYKMDVNNEAAMGAWGWVWHVSAILIMIGLGRLAKPWLSPRKAGHSSSGC